MNATFEVLDRNHAEPTDEATVSFDDTAVIIRGTIVGKDGGTTAALESVAFDDENTTVTVRIETEPDDSAGAFVTMALVGIEYRIDIDSEERPDTVVVEHHGVNDWQTTESPSEPTGT